MALAKKRLFSYLIISKGRRNLLLTPGPYLSVIAGAVIFSPVIIWNINHGFASFAFQGSRVGVSGIKLKYFFRFFAGQLGYLLPFIFIPALAAAVRSITKIKKTDSYNSFVFCFGAVPVVFFMTAALFKKILPHWPVIGYMTLALPVGKYYADLRKTKNKIFNLFAVSHISLIIIAVSLTIGQIKWGIIFNREANALGPAEKSGKISDISTDILGWNELYSYLKSHYPSGNIFLFSNKWYLCGHIAFASKGKYDVLCLSSVKDARGFIFWQKQKDQIGKEGLFITTDRYFKNPEVKYSEYFDRIELIRLMPVKRRGVIVKIIYVYKCSNFRKEYLII